MAKRRCNGEKEGFWRDVIARQATSGLSVRAFCRARSLSEPSLYSWRRVLASREADPADKAAFLAFADQVNRDLDACGFPLCKGDVMARNPRWCLTLDEWRQVFAGWIHDTDGKALLDASIFFDFRALAGAARLAGALRDHVLPQTRADRAFCRAMAEVAEYGLVL